MVKRTGSFMLIKPALGNYECNVNFLKSGLTIMVKAGLERILLKMLMVILKVYSIFNFIIPSRLGGWQDVHNLFKQEFIPQIFYASASPYQLQDCSWCVLG